VAELTFEYPTWLVAVALALGAVAAMALYYRDSRAAELPLWTRRTLAALRGASVALIVVLLLGPMLRTVQNEVEKPIIVLAQDVSASVALNRDSVWYRTAYQASLDSLRTRLADRFTLESYAFDGSVRPLPDTLRFDGQRTDLTSLFEDLESRYANRNVGAVVLASDGVMNRGIDPAYRPLRLKGTLYTVALGDTARPRDLLVRRVEHNRYAYLGNEFPLEAELEADLMKGRTMRVSVSDDRGTLAQREVAVPTDRFRITLSFKLKAETPGLMRYRVDIQPIDGEMTRRNNSKEALIEVIDSRQKVLILAAAPHPDVATLKRALQQNINLEVTDQLPTEGVVEPSKYSLIVLHQLPDQTVAGREVADKVLRSDVPLWLMVGSKSDIRAFNGLQTGASINSPNNALNAAFPALSPGFGLFNVDEGLRRLLPKLPPLNARFGEHPVTKQVTPLFTQRIGNVETDMWLWAFSQMDGRKVALTAGDGLWRWAMTDYRENGTRANIEGLVQKTVQYLAVTADRSQFRVAVGNSFMEDEPVIFHAELYNDAYEPTNTPEVSLALRRQDGTETTYTMGRTETAYRLNTGTLPPGDYTYLARTQLADRILTAKGMLRVGALQAEALNTVSDHRTLANMATATGGHMFRPTQMSALADSIVARQDIRNVIYSHERFREAIHLKWVFALLALLLCAEWGLRRWGGVY
jgi:hypothetical protein